MASSSLETIRTVSPALPVSLKMECSKHERVSFCCDCVVVLQLLLSEALGTSGPSETPEYCEQRSVRALWPCSAEERMAGNCKDLHSYLSCVALIHDLLEILQTLLRSGNCKHARESILFPSSFATTQQQNIGLERTRALHSHGRVKWIESSFRINHTDLLLLLLLLLFVILLSCPILHGSGSLRLRPTATAFMMRRTTSTIQQQQQIPLQADSALKT